MPNDCWNHMTVTADKDVIENFFQEELKNIPDWALNIHKKGVEGLIFRIWSPWIPDFAWLEGLLDKYSGIWLKNEWSEEGGQEGVWIGTNREDKKYIQRLEWMGMCLEEEFHRFTPLKEAI